MRILGEDNYTCRLCATSRIGGRLSDSIDQERLVQTTDVEVKPSSQAKTNPSTITAAGSKSYPWERPFWKPMKGKRAIFLYLVAIHVLAVTGLILFPLPSLRVAVLTLILICLG